MVLPFAYLDSPMAEFLFKKYLLFLISAIFRGEKGVKVRPNLETLGISHFCKNLNFSKILQTLFVYPGIIPLVKISTKSGNIWGS